MSQQQPSERQSSSLSPSEVSSLASVIPSTTGRPIAESKGSLFRPVPKTEDDGDCAFHAVLGVWNEKEQRIICAEAKQCRAELERAIADSKAGSRVRELAVAGIKELIMTGRGVGKESRQLLQKHQRFLADQDALAPQLWQTFEVTLPKYPHVMQYIAEHHKHPQGDDASLRDQFYDALNRNNGDLYALIRSLTDLDVAFKQYNELDQIRYDWEAVISSNIITEYAQFVGRPGQWLLPSEVAILAEVFHTTVEYYSAPGAQVEIINPDQQRRVVVQFDGRSHFEQVRSAPKDDKKKGKSSQPSLAAAAFKFAISFPELEKITGHLADKAAIAAIRAILAKVQKEMQEIENFFPIQDRSLYYPEILVRLEVIDQLVEQIPALPGFYHSIRDAIQKAVAPLQKKACEFLLPEGGVSDAQLLTKTQTLYAQQALIMRDKTITQALSKTLSAILKLPGVQVGQRCFISYAWPMPDHQVKESWLQPFLRVLHDHLRQAGIKPLLDIADNQPGASIATFTNQTKSYEFAILMCTDSLADKHHDPRFKVIQTELSLLRQKYDLDIARGQVRVFPLLVSGSRISALLPEHHLYRTVRDWRAQSYVKNLEQLIGWICYPQGVSDAYQECWQGFYNRYPSLETLMPDEAVQAELREKYHHKKMQELEAKAFYRKLLDQHFVAVKKEQKRKEDSDEEDMVTIHTSSRISSHDTDRSSLSLSSAPPTASVNKKLHQEEKSSSASVKIQPSADPLSSPIDAKTLPIPKRFAVGNSDFKAVREQKGLIVDKSLFIKDVLDDITQVKLIIRPRRFGKTFNLSMLRHFFDRASETRDNLFQGLNIWSEENKAYRTHHKKYPVIFLTLKDIKASTFEEALEAFGEVISELYRELQEKYGFESTDKVKQIIENKASKTRLQFSLQALTKILYETCDNTPVILLIDEYDTPLHAAYSNTPPHQLDKENNKEEYDNGYYGRMSVFMQGLLGPALKDNSCLHSAILTGILRVAKESIFSGLNNLRIYSILDNDFSSYFGFSEEEVRMQLQSAFELEADETLYRQAKGWYGGYQVGKNSLFNPWSISNFIEYNRQHQAGELFKFKDYWINTSENALVKNLLLKADKSTKREFQQLVDNKPIVKMLSEHTVFYDIDKTPTALWSFLLLSGYLTTYSNPAAKLDHPSKYQLVIPNQEIHNFYEDQLKTWLIEEVKETKNQLPDFLSIGQKRLTLKEVLTLVREGNPDNSTLNLILEELTKLNFIGQLGIEILQTILEKEHVGIGIKQMAMNVLERLVLQGDRSAIETAINQLHEESFPTTMQTNKKELHIRGQVRRRAASILGKSPVLDGAILQALRTALMDKQKDIRSTAAQAILRFAARPNGEAAKKIILNVLTTSSYPINVRVTVAEALGDEGPLNDNEIIEALTQLTDQAEDEEVASAAKDALEIMLSDQTPSDTQEKKAFEKNIKGQGAPKNSISPLERSSSVIKTPSAFSDSPPSSSPVGFFSATTTKDYNTKSQQKNVLLKEIDQLIDRIYPPNDQAAEDARNSYLQRLAKYRKSDFVMTAKDQADLEELRTRLLEQQPREKGFNSVVS